MDGSAPNRRQTILTATLVVLATSGACADTLGEGKRERDPGEPPTGAGDTGDASDGTEPDPDVMPSDETVCYPGEDQRWTTCLPLVSWDASWGADYEYPEPLDGDPQYRSPLRYIDLHGAEAAADTPLAPNFVLGELMQRRKGRFGLFQPHSLAHLQTIRDAIGGPLTINSGYRNVTYNAGVGGATWSRHLYGDAADMASSAASLDELGALCEELGAGYVGYYETHVHCDWRDDPLEQAFFAEAATFQATGHGWAVHGIHASEGVLRIRWEARAAGGGVLAHHTGRTFQPPAGTSYLLADIGGVRTLALRLARGEAPK
ncbi:MAG: D-Ala-D-Ala carboxypeptidase family metallohydrolase [Myxococcota bacterium]|nr:D-Ala-D-Ala carboxypeptidase family metallohydrolase [Myxococcota bacterium]MEC8425249.1 D-Ala-D-Ala carboxypeptidase family metallohydrolase [Myxococcota bacterium]